MSKMSRTNRYDDIQLNDDGHTDNHCKDRTDGIIKFPSSPSLSSSTHTPSFRSSYQMTIAGGFLDFALFVADVEHLKFILDSGREDIRYYTLLLVLILSSLLLQFVVVVLLFIVGFKQSKQNDKTITRQHEESDGSTTVVTLPADNGQAVLNNVIVVLVTVIAIINVFITVFGDRSEATLIARYKHDMSFFNVTPHNL